MGFIDDYEKMFDFFRLSKEEFLTSYSYLTEEEYDATVMQLITFWNDIKETLKDFYKATDDDTDNDWLSDGEWLDVFVELCERIYKGEI